MSMYRLLPVLFAGACVVVGDARSSGRTDRGGANVVVASDSTAQSPAAGPNFTEGSDGSVSMTTRNGALVMSLRHDSIVVAFSDSIRRKVRSEVTASTDKHDAAESAIGEVVRGVVKSAVTGALTEVFDKARGFPVSTLRDVRYEDGAMRFDYLREPAWTFDSFKVDDEPLLEQFHPADAARFVGAVRAQLRRR